MEFSRARAERDDEPDVGCKRFMVSETMLPGPGHRSWCNWLS